MTGRVLHVLSQRPHLTGSGVTLDALVGRAASAGWQQAVVVGTCPEEPQPEFESLASDRVYPLVFGRGELDFPLPGMSDVMPYESSRFSSLSPSQLDRYLGAWRRHLREVVQRFEPDLIHVHHIWLVAAVVAEIANGRATVVHSHATGLRQMTLCPHLADFVRQGNRRHDRYLVLTADQSEEVRRRLDLPSEKISEIGAGFRQDIFHSRGRIAEPGPSLLYAGKLSSAKGLPWLLEAVDGLRAQIPGLELRVAGGGGGDEAEALRGRMQELGSTVRYLGRLDQRALAERLRGSAALVLPSFYEGLPLVLAEALACGCRLVATELPGVMGVLANRFGDALETVRLPRLETVDRPCREDLPRFVEGLSSAIGKTLSRSSLTASAFDLDAALEPFTWKSVFDRVEAIWRTCIEQAGRS